MTHPHPERLALAAMAWSRLERLLTEQGQALDDIETKRADYVRVLVDCWEAMPELMEKNIPDPERIFSLEQTQPKVFTPDIAPVRIVREAGTSNRSEVPALDAAPGVIGQAVWYARTDPIAWGHEPPTPRSGPGFTCRRCGARVRRARHTDPRLVCLACLGADR